MNERDVKYISIPIEVWERPDLNPFEKMLLAEIDSLDRGKGCWKSNKALAERMVCSLGHLRNTLSKLKKLRWLKSKLKGDMRLMRTCFSRHLHLSHLPDVRKILHGGCKKEITPDVRKKLHRHHTTYDTSRTVKNEPGMRLDSRVRLFGKADRSPVTKMTLAFAEHSIKRRYHLGKRGSTKTGWTKQTLNQWRKILQQLVDQSGEIDHVKMVLDWYLRQPNAPYLPCCWTLPTFCQKFSQIKQAMRRTDAPVRPNQEPGQGGYYIRKVKDLGNGRKIIDNTWVPDYSE